MDEYEETPQSPDCDNRRPAGIDDRTVEAAIPSGPRGSARRSWDAT